MKDQNLPSFLRKLTILMNPFMSCGARLPVYALFAAAFFPTNGQNLVFGLYLITRPTSPVKLILRGFRLRPRMLWNLTRIGVPSSMQFVVRVVA